ncbi:unnamed protein product [Thlaspi arvense]|uniref:DUF4283 domain-containing protein n=1 Tax=Thlaspi arvense TaxID=13288 RepID=A0AAU9T8W7_THLAR|nr:unnamed protein product [Thlaspi arvense]
MDSLVKYEACGWGSAGRGEGRVGGPGYRHKAAVWFQGPLGFPACFNRYEGWQGEREKVAPGLQKVGVTEFSAASLGGTILPDMDFRFGEIMEQYGGSHLGSANGSNKGKATLLPRLKITVPRFDNTELINGYPRTLIGWCMNPLKQDMNALLVMFLRIWKVEDYVAGADLGMGHFQFDFDEEEDITSVLQMEPYHFDGWIVVLVRWEPIGEAIGDVHAIDLDGGRVRLTLDAFKPIIFETMVEFQGGVETVVILRYERLQGCCREYHSICHDTDRCPVLYPKRERSTESRYKEDKPDGGVTSYKGALTSNGISSMSDREPQQGSKDMLKGKGKISEVRETRKAPPSGVKLDGDNSGGHRVAARSYPPREGKQRYGGITRGIHRGQERFITKQKVRKELDFKQGEIGMDDLGVMIDRVAMGDGLEDKRNNTVTSDHNDPAEEEFLEMGDDLGDEDELGALFMEEWKAEVQHKVKHDVEQITDLGNIEELVTVGGDGDGSLEESEN